jgi:hypothetical protein
MHRCNRAECAIHTFKDHFLAILADVDSAFPPYLWDLLLLQAKLTLNLLCQATLNRQISAWDFFQGPFDFNKMLLGPDGCRVLIHISLHLAGPGTSVPKMASTVVQPWSHTAASNWSMQTPRVRLSQIRLNFTIPTSLSLPCPQRIE